MSDENNNLVESPTEVVGSEARPEDSCAPAGLSDVMALWLRINAAKVRLAAATEPLERIALRNEIGDLSQRIRKAQRRGTQNDAHE